MLKMRKDEVIDEEVIDAEVTEVQENETEEKPKSNLKRNLLIGAGILGAVVTTAFGISSARRSRQEAMDALMFRDMDEETDEDDPDKTEDSDSEETTSE